MNRPVRVSPRVPSQDYREMLACLQSHRKELLAFRDDPGGKINKQCRQIEHLEMLLAAERARLHELTKLRSEIQERIDANDERILQVRQQVLVREKMEKIEKARQIMKELRALEADCGQSVTEDQIVS